MIVFNGGEINVQTWKVSLVAILWSWIKKLQGVQNKTLFEFMDWLGD